MGLFTLLCLSVATLASNVQQYTVKPVLLQLPAVAAAVNHINTSFRKIESCHVFLFESLFSDVNWVSRDIWLCSVCASAEPAEKSVLFWKAQ